uniref:Uncharacterized protein n=1 Tax=Arundo donax TaxID=35708 RepID=A0A0A9EZN5_ARUDO
MKKKKWNCHFTLNTTKKFVLFMHNIGARSSSQNMGKTS